HVAEFYNWDAVQNASADEQAAFLRRTAADVILHVLPRQDIARAAKRSHIPLRVGTTNRLFHWGACNRLIRLSRRKSSLHEAQLNLQLLRPLEAPTLFSHDEIAKLYGLTVLKPLRQDLAAMLAKDRFNLILHPTSGGSALEWGIRNFAALIEGLPRDRFALFITGSASDGKRLAELLQDPLLHDMTGKLTLEELISFIAAADGLLAASTGPLHLAAALGIHAIGLFSSRRPIHPGRWAPLGDKADYIEDGIRTPYQGNLQIAPQLVLQKLQGLCCQAPSK
ncbi:glycosyltransferase family 9 protein, partial [candidate division KSB1 bacterium]